MLQHSATRSCPGPLSRRDFLKLGPLALGGGIGLSSLLAQRARGNSSATPATNDTSVILLWLPGGPPHMETYDMKPDAPEDYRGEFRPIRTNVRGIDVCELLPRHARVADRFALIRSIAHTFSDHGGGHKKFLTGRDPFEPTGFVNDHPMVGSMVAKVREKVRRGLPNYVAVTDPGRQGIDVFSFGSAYLGPSTHPFIFGGDPSSPKFQVPNLEPNPQIAKQLPDRLALLEKFDAPSSALENTADKGGMKVAREKAVELLESTIARKAFDINSEPTRLRERYGMHAWGQRCLLARRLVEHGASFVTMVLENPYQSGVPWLKEGTYNWDSHAVNCHIFNDAKARMPIFDRCVPALIEDLYDRGLDRKVLLIVTGEFGRTPRISYSNGTQTGVKQPGRDHWPQAMSVLVSGGGMPMGQVIGSTNAKGEHPKDRPLTPNDLWATMFKHLGIEYDKISFPDHTGRPMPILGSGEPIKELS